GGPSSRTPWLCLPLVCAVSRADRSGTLVAHGEGVQDLRRGDVTPGIDGLLFPGNLGTGTRGTRGKGHDHLRRRRRPATTARAGVRACASAATEEGEGTGIARAAHEVDRGSTWDWDSRSYAGRVRRACLRLLPRRHSAVTGVWISVVRLVAGVVLVLLVAMRS